MPTSRSRRERRRRWLYCVALPCYLLALSLALLYGERVRWLVIALGPLGALLLVELAREFVGARRRAKNGRG
ncbi:hypothetical protein SAMN05421810_11321 [Amycolatopsis arida]|uniref:Uncharacterized protein n=1 Tax=Amycolatopsis arida TaxID=587909 RepID=A0A1I6AK18_9PSEU|nr:hypothetical protein CLV69_11321 [Amycolatopsis arida]SFQ69038.1 hypothetical protein SAMN05421810_11321 [Amycolatopsis arida]